MPIFKFCITGQCYATAEAKTKEEARIKIVDTQQDYAEMLVYDCEISDGELM